MYKQAREKLESKYYANKQTGKERRKKAKKERNKETKKDIKYLKR